LDYVCGLSVPQLIILESNLRKICDAENGVEAKNNEEKNVSNRIAYGATIRMLQEKTGRKEFSLTELMNPEQTIRMANGKDNKSNSRSPRKG